MKGLREMTTVAQLSKLADKWFNNQMRRRGFAVGKKFDYWRKRGALYDNLWGEILSSGNSLRVYATIWSPWIESPVGDLGTFSPCPVYIGEQLVEGFYDEFGGGELLDVGDDKSTDESLVKVLDLFDRCALPWFKGADSCDGCLAYIDHPHCVMRKNDKLKLKESIIQGFGREQYP